MPREVVRRALSGVALVAAVACAGAAAQLLRMRQQPQPDEAQVVRGRALFQQGAGLTGYIGAERIPLETDLVACARCHGERARGATGGEATPPVHARALFAPVASGDPERPPRPAYDRESLGRALREGHAASGRTLQWLMPRFDLSEAQLEDLIAYLEVVEEERSPGVHADRIVLGTVLPSSGRFAGAAAKVREVLEAAFAEVNAQGGLYGKRLELQLLAPGDQARGVFALVSSVYPSPVVDEPLASEQGVPLVAPVGFEGSMGTAPVFTVFPGLADQARWAIQQLGACDGVAVVRTEDGAARAWADAALEECARRAEPLPDVIALPNGSLDAREVAQRLSEVKAHQVLAALPADAFTTLANEAEAFRWIAPGALARPELALQRPESVRFVYPAQGSGATDALQAFLSRHGLEAGHVAFQLNALAGARVLIEALRGSGANPTRNELVAAIERLQDFHTGVTPPLTFGRANHVGVCGAQWVRVDPSTRTLVPASEWVALSP